MSTFKDSDKLEEIEKQHAYLQATLPELSQLVTKILRVHGPNHEELLQLHSLFHTLKMELEQRQIKKEELLYPLIKEYAQSGSKEVLDKALQQIEVLENEHQDTGSLLKQIREVTSDYFIPEDACKTFRKTYEMLEELESHLFH